MESPEISRTYSSLGLTPKALERVRATRVLVGFDGFVDEIVTPVAAREKTMPLSLRSHSSPSASEPRGAGATSTSE